MRQYNRKFSLAFSLKPITWGDTGRYKVVNKVRKVVRNGTKRVKIMWGNRNPVKFESLILCQKRKAATKVAAFLFVLFIIQHRVVFFVDRWADIRTHLNAVMLAAYGMRKNLMLIPETFRIAFWGQQCYDM